MPIVKQVVGARTALPSAALATLASANYCASSVKDNTANQPLDVMVEVTVGTGTAPSGNKQVVVFAQASYDNVVWQSGPNTGASATDEALLTYLGVIPVQTLSVVEVKSFSVAAAYGGILPPYFKVICKNDAGVVLTSGSIATAEISATVI